MFLGIQDAVNMIVETVKSSLGPLATLTITMDDLRDFLIQLSATIILFIIVRVFLWKPITEILEKRREAIDKALVDAQDARDNAQEIESKLQSELDAAKSQVKEMLDKAEKDANQKRDQIVNDAKAEARRRLDNLELELVQEKKNMEKDIRQEIVDIAFAAAEKIVAKEINQDKYLDIVDDILKGAAN